MRIWGLGLDVCGFGFRLASAGCWVEDVGGRGLLFGFEGS